VNNKLDFSNSPNSLQSFRTFGKPGVVKETNLDLVNAEAMLAAAADSLRQTPTDGSSPAADPAPTSTTSLFKPALKGTPDPMTSSLIVTSDAKLMTSSGTSLGDGGGDKTPVTLERITEASDRLKGVVDKLALAGNKTSTNFMLLSEEVTHSQLID
jgi:hypothetical protein